MQYVGVCNEKININGNIVSVVIGGKSGVVSGPIPPSLSACGACGVVFVALPPRIEGYCVIVVYISSDNNNNNNNNSDTQTQLMSFCGTPHP